MLKILSDERILEAVLDSDLPMSAKITIDAYPALLNIAQAQARLTLQQVIEWADSRCPHFNWTGYTSKSCPQCWQELKEMCNE